MNDTVMAREALPATALLAAFAVEMQTMPLSEEVWQKAAVCLADAVGLAVVGGREKTAAAVADLFTTPAGAGVTVWCSAGASEAPTLSVLDAVMANATAVHAHFQDDCDMTSWSHPGSLISPVAVALAEKNDLSLDVVLRSIIAGYAALNWLGADEIVGRAVVSRGVRASPTLGPVAAAVAGSVALGLTASQTQSAIGIAADVAGGTLEPVRSGAESWRIQNGSAAWRGALAALLAQAEVVGSPAALEGDKGFAMAFAGISPPSQWASAPDPERILTVWEKAFPTLGDNIAVSRAAAELSRLAAGETASITRIVVHQNAEFASYPGTSYRGPYVRPAQAMASTAFAVAVALMHGAITVESYETMLDDQEMLRLVSILTVVAESGYDYTDGSVEVTRGESRASVAANELPRNQLFRDPASARAALAATVGPASGRLADLILDTSETGRSVPVRTLMTQLSQSQRQ